jgi:hypothetical protein
MLCCRCVSLPPFWYEPFMRSAPLGQGVILNRRVVVSTNIFILNLSLKLCNRIRNSNYNKV